MLRERMLKAALMHSVATPQSPTQIPTISQPVETMRDASYCAAKAVVGGRFANESIALKASEFRCADLGFVKIYVKRLQQNDQAVRLCKELNWPGSSVRTSVCPRFCNRLLVCSHHA